MRAFDRARHPFRLDPILARLGLSGAGRHAARQLDGLRAYLGESAVPSDRSHWSARWLRPKGNLTRGQLAVLLAIAITPLIVAALRISALPGVLGPGLGGGLVPSIGHDLNQMLSLQEIPAGDRSRVLYMLFLPMGAMLIAFARLTFGLRVIGFRAILISVGFQESGIVPSMILIAVVVAIVVGVRPALVRIRLPYYARVSVIMSISVLVLLTALLVAPWMRSEVLWGVAFFPVIVLGLLAEGIAKTLDQNSGLTAIWRTGMTIGIALLLAGVGQIPMLREVAIQLPELVVTQLITVILISEFLDLRLFQDWDARLSGEAIPRLFSRSDTLRVAVVRNRRRNGVIGQIGTPTRNGPSRRSIRRVVRAIREAGHTVKVVEGDMLLMAKLRDFIPPHPRTGQPGGLVLDLSHGIQGELAATHVAAMLEMAGVPYAGSPLHGRLAMADKALTGSLLEQAGVRTPEWHIARRPNDAVEGLAYPLVVKPRHATRYKLRVARDRRQLEEAIRTLSHREQQEVVFEPYVSGREIQVALIGNRPVKCLPLVEAQPGKQERACPASVDPILADRIRENALAAFEACGCRDHALVNIRVSPSGRVYVLEVEEPDILEPSGAFELAAEAAGLGFADLIQVMIDTARTRYRAQASGETVRAVSPPKLEVSYPAKGGIAAGVER